MKSNIIDEEPLPLKQRVVPDTSIVVEGFLSRKIEKGELLPEEVIIHEAVLAELESQANKNKETGFLGLEEVKKLRFLAEDKNFSVSFKGSRPTDFEIKHAKTGEIDSLIRQLASDEKATLVTADKVQSLVAESKGIRVILYEFEEEESPFVLDKYFDESTMSVHIKENCLVKAKRGVPGKWEFATLTDEVVDRDSVKELAKEIVEEATARQDGFVESDRKGSTVVQLGNNRIVLVRPPFSDGYEITCVRPIMKMALNDYDLSEKVVARLSGAAEGILIAGAPGQGKSTFASALAEMYLSRNKVVKTIESPRDLVLGDEVTQYSLSHGSSGELQDILLLSRPDYTIFDEMRSTEDFRLFSDLRLSGVGMVGVVHATKPIDAVQRFLGRLDLGVIPHIIDTVIFIDSGGVAKVFLVGMDVKVPGGMTESDLARPVVTIHDFESGRLEFEIYTYGEENVIVPVKVESQTPILRLAESAIRREVRDFASKVDVDIQSDYKCRLVVPLGEKASFIGDGGLRIKDLENRLGLKIDVVEEAEKSSLSRSERKESINFSIKQDKKNILIDVGQDRAEVDVDIYVDDDFLFSARSSKKGVINISLGNAMGKMIQGSLASGRTLVVRAKLS